MNTKILKSSLLAILLSSSVFAGSTINIDNGSTEIALKNNTANVLNFPFIVKEGKIASSTEENFQVSTSKYSVVVIPTADNKEERADLIVWSNEGYTYLIKLSVTGEIQTFDLTTNKIHNDNIEATEFESGAIDADIKKLMKLVILNKYIPGYRKTEVNRQFVTPDMLMQKNTMYDGGKYRLEKWLLKNETSSTLTLDEGSFYTKGILSIAFESPKIPVGAVTNMYLIIDKASLVKEN